MASGNGDGHAVTRSRCRVALRPAGGAAGCEGGEGGGGWRAHEFEVWSGGGAQLVCRAAALRMRGSLLLWVGGARAALGEAALAVAGGAGEAEGGGAGEAGAAAAATALLPGEGAAVALAMARRLAAALHKPVFVFCGASFDRFALPLVERGVIAEIKSRPECF